LFPLDSHVCNVFSPLHVATGVCEVILFNFNNKSCWNIFYHVSYSSYNSYEYLMRWHVACSDVATTETKVNNAFYHTICGVFDEAHQRQNTAALQGFAEETQPAHLYQYNICVRLTSCSKRSGVNFLLTVAISLGWLPSGVSTCYRNKMSYKWSEIEQLSTKHSLSILFIYVSIWSIINPSKINMTIIRSLLWLEMTSAWTYTS